MNWNDCLCVDRPRLRRLTQKIQRSKPSERAALQEKCATLAASSRAALAERQAQLPVPEFSEDLPVNQKRDEIASTIAAHQVVIICGETGSGKTTQLPKICLSLGRGAAGLIGHTQPRRIAARATASRIAQELNSPLGQAVGYKIRFTDRVSPNSAIKLMTDGILLAETQGDPDLDAYDTIIIDEAHERSTNIDFLLGYLKQLLTRRPDLKVIVTSATLDANRFARHFGSKEHPAPIIEVSGRLHPIEIRYRPIMAETQTPSASAKGPSDRDLYDALVDAVDEAHRTGPGDALVFLPGEREIREAAEALRKAHHAAQMEIVPLFARQSAQEQTRVFTPSQGRRVVLATNVAETSLTVPGIRYVIDTGLARIKRYSHRNKVEQLQVEKISRASAQQRSGRCGRVAAGVCFRLYDEADFTRRPAHTEPEMLRASLASVILRMYALKLGAVEDFPFIDAPSSRMINDGYQLLEELGALSEDRDGNKHLTPLGQELAKLPLDPKIGRMILAGRQYGCLKEMLVIAAALSVQDPRDRPAEQAGTADQRHALFRGGEQDQKSEFLWYWNLWKAYDHVLRHESSARQKAWCKQHFLSIMRMREWRDIHGQLHGLAAEHGWKENEQPAHYNDLHKALLTGLLGHIGCKVEDDRATNTYQGARGIKFWPHPGSTLAKKAGKWIMAAELVDTSRLFARCLAKIDPLWLEEVGAHLLRRHLSEPHWSKSAGSVRAWERGTLHGITLYAKRPVSYRQHDPALCRSLFIQQGLVAGEIEDSALRQMPFLKHNQKLVAEIEALEHKSRRPDVLVDETLIEAFYDQHLPDTVLDLVSFEKWRREAEKANPKLLYLTRDALMRHEADGITTERFPASLHVLGQSLKLSYLHAPGEADDGVTLTVPLALLNQVPAHRCEWLVPGLLEAKVLALLKTVPQKHRHRLQPLAESAEAFCEQAEAGAFDPNEPLLRALQNFVEDRVQLKLPLESFRPENLPPHSLMNFRVIDEHGRVLAQSRSLNELRTRFKREIQAHFENAQIKSVTPVTPAPKNTAHADPTAAAVPPPPDGATRYTQWTWGALPELLEVVVAGRNIIGFPALVDEGDAVTLRPFDTPEEAARIHRTGLIRLFTLNLKEQVRALEKIPGLRELALQFVAFGTEAELKAQLVAATLTRTCLVEPLPHDAPSFETRLKEAKPRMTLVGQELVRLLSTLLTERQTLEKRLGNLKQFPSIEADLKNQLAALFPKNFITTISYEHLTHYPRYLKAANLRIDKLRANPARDAQLQADWNSLAAPFERERIAKRKAGVEDEALEAFRWLLEELRVSLYAQELKTPMPVSVKRLQKIWESRLR